MNFEEFKNKFQKCPYCGGSNFKQWTHLIDGSALEFTCNDCWSSDFGWRMTFTIVNDLIDDAANAFMLAVWNGTNEAWFYFGVSPYFEKVDPNYFSVLIVKQGPSSDYPVSERLVEQFLVPKTHFDSLFQSREYISNWIKKLGIVE